VSEDVEDRLARLMADTLGVPAVDRTRTFFAQGGQSLLATSLVARVEREFGARLSLRDVFDHPTVGAMAGRIRARAGTGRRLPRGRRSNRVPLAPAQESFWRVARLVPESTAFNQVIRIDVQGRVDSDLLVEALRDVVTRHDALRVTFSGSGEQAVQTVHRRAEVPIVRDVPHGGRREAIRRVTAQEERLTFDLERQIPIRARLLQFSATDRILVVTTHHIAFDGWSRGILVDDLAACYRARAAGSPPPAPVRGFADFAFWQHGQRAAGAWKESVETWRAVLTPPAPAFRLPGATEPGDDYRTVRRRVLLDADAAGSVGAFAQAEGATAFTVLMSAFMAVVALSCDADEGCAALQVANRTWSEVAGMIGPFANTLVLRARLDRSRGFRHFLHEVQKAASLAYDLQDVPFEHVIDELRDVVDLPALLRVGFALHAPYPDAEVPGGRLATGPGQADADEDAQAGGDVDPTMFELVLELRPDPDTGGYRGAVTYKSGVYPPAVVEAFVARYTTFLSAVLADPGLAIGAAA
jgi:acyl carrier protein